jgi:cell division protein ZapE
MPNNVAERYEALVRSGAVEHDPHQVALVAQLDGILAALRDKRLQSKKSSLGWLFAKGGKPRAVDGLYIWGGVGRGKTMLMDEFFELAPNVRKQRAHFHEFMADVHSRIARFRKRLKAGEIKGDDPIVPVADEIATEVRLLCFDEFSVTDIADAMILGRLFERLFERGLTVIATSNVAPDELYKNGLNRALFLPFIELIKAHMGVFHLDASKDFRLEKLGSEPVYLTPLGLKSDRILDNHFERLSGVRKGSPQTLVNGKRGIPVREAAGGVARFTFDELCARPLGAADYLKIARAFHTVIISDIPVMSPEIRNEARRFINLIDTFYDRKVRLVVSAAAPPEQLWRGTDGNEAFEFARTSSRLIEMQSDAYLGAGRPGDLAAAE